MGTVGLDASLRLCVCSQLAFLAAPDLSAVPNDENAGTSRSQCFTGWKKGRKLAENDKQQLQRRWQHRRRRVQVSPGDDGMLPLNWVFFFFFLN